MTLRLWDLDPVTYARHPLHGDDRAWPESTCSVDLWVGPDVETSGGD